MDEYEEDYYGWDDSATPSYCCGICYLADEDDCACIELGCLDDTWVVEYDDSDITDPVDKEDG